MKCREYVMCPGFYQVLGIVFCVVVFIKCSVDACTCICQLLGLYLVHMSGCVSKLCQVFV